VFFAKDLKAVDKAMEFIDAFNGLQLANTIHLNRPTVWTFQPGGRWATIWCAGRSRPTVKCTNVPNIGLVQCVPCALKSHRRIHG